MTDACLSADLETMIDIARKAGALAQSLRGQATRTAWEKAPGDPVTEADLAVDRLIAKRLKAARPAYGWLSEETADHFPARQRDRVWVVDPIDGTKAYIRPGDPHWCIGIALVEHGQPVASVVFAPDLGELYVAEAGRGASLNGAPVFASTQARLEGCRMIASTQMLRHPGWPKPWPDVTMADPRPNATLLRLAWVACGRWDATMAMAQKSDWDLAAGALLVAEAGGVASTHLGEAFQFNRRLPAQRSLIAAGKRLHRLLVQRTEGVLRPSGADVYAPVDTPEAPVSDRRKPAERRAMSDAEMPMKQLLHLVIGGELKDVTEVEFEDLSKLDFVGAFGNYEAAYDAWKSAAQRTVDHAEMRYFILHAHKLLDPETGNQHAV
ncbi:MAG: inositol monophosphatase family protein [Pseudomonadota bacterium]